MADLLTHACAAILVKAALRHPRMVPTFVAGTCLPDLLGRVPPMALARARWDLPWIPEWTVYVFAPLHVPAGIAAAAYLASFAFSPGRRPCAFRNLLGGGMLHLAVDLLQRHFGVGYLLLFPFSTTDLELGLLGSEDTVLLVPALVPATIAIAFWRWRQPAATSKP
jgi:hypothetical protein